MSFFGDLKIICSHVFNKGKDKVIDTKNKTIDQITDIKNEVIYGNIKGNRNSYNYENVSYYTFGEEYISDLEKYKNLFALFGYNKKGSLYLTDKITVNPLYRVKPYISISVETGYDIYFNDDKNSKFIEFGKLYSDKGKFIGNSNNNKVEKIPSDSIKSVSYRNDGDDTYIDYDFGLSRHISIKVGTILRRHKTSGTAYNQKHDEKLDIITNLYKYKLERAILVDSEGEYLSVKHFGGTFIPKLVFDVVNNALLFCMFEVRNREVCISKIESAFFHLNKTDYSTEYVELCLCDGRSLLLYSENKCFLHDRKY